MARTPSLNPKKLQVIVRPRDEIEAEAIKYFREVVLRDRLDLTTEFVKMVNNYWKTKHPPPGNPQKQMTQFSKEHTHSHTRKCSNLDCALDAIWEAKTIFPVRTVRDLCTYHLKKMESKREIVSKVKIVD